MISVTEQPKSTTSTQETQKAKPNFAAFAARVRAQQQEQKEDTIPTSERPKRPLLEAILPTVRQPVGRSFVPTPLPQRPDIVPTALPQRPEKTSDSSSSSSSRFSSFPVQNDTPSRPSGSASTPRQSQPERTAPKVTKSSAEVQGIQIELKIHLFFF